MSLREPQPEAVRPSAHTILPRKQVLARAGLSNSTIWRLQRRGDFPKPVVLSPGRVGWRACDVEAWIDSRVPRGDS